MDAAFLDQRDRIVRHAVDLTGTLGLGTIDLVQPGAAALGDGKARIGRHLRRFHLAVSRQHILDELLHDVGLVGVLADAVGLGPLDPTFFWHHGANGRAILFQNAGDPVADTAHRQHLAIFQRVEGSAIVEIATNLRAKGQRCVLNGLPLVTSQIPQTGAIALIQTDHAKAWQVPVEMTDFPLYFRLPEA